jgi:hypothetical protein
MATNAAPAMAPMAMPAVAPGERVLVLIEAINKYLGQQCQVATGEFKIKYRPVEEPEAMDDVDADVAVDVKVEDDMVF